MFCRTESNFGQTGSIRRHLARCEHNDDCRKLSVAACLPATGRERMPFAFTTQCAYGPRISPSSRKLRLGRTPSTSKSLRYRGQYNHGMADRIACSCVTCPKCGTWVVVRQPSEAGLANEKHRATCPVPECGKEFEFEVGETRVFEVPLPLFERRHFYGSELR